MGIKLTKVQRAALDKIIATLEQAHSDANELWQELESEFSDKSDKWQESDAGQEYSDDLSSLEDWASQIESVAADVPLGDA